MKALKINFKRKTSVIIPAGMISDVFSAIDYEAKDPDKSLYSVYVNYGKSNRGEIKQSKVASELSLGQAEKVMKEIMESLDISVALTLEDL